MADVKGDVLWVKKDSKTLDEDIWDDAELIKLYDRSIAHLKKEPKQTASSNCQASEKEQLQKKKKKKKKSKNTNYKWKVGRECLALYDWDGLYYEAIILSIDNDYKTVRVRFLYHGNEEDVDMKNLLEMSYKDQMGCYDSKDANNTIDDAEIKSCDGTNTTDNEKDSNRPVTKDWRVSDICYVLDKKGVHHQAVINYFNNSDCCFVTFIKSNQKKEVKLSQLHSFLPREYKRTRSKSLSPPNHFPHPNCPPPDFPMQIPPPPSLLANSGFPAIPSFNKNFSFRNTTDNIFCGSNFPSCPQPPVIPDDVIAGNEEALANMLMSWYISGFHTGYYQGIQQANLPTQRDFQNNKYRHERKKNKRYHEKTKVSNV